VIFDNSSLRVESRQQRFSRSAKIRVRSGGGQRNGRRADQGRSLPAIRGDGYPQLDCRCLRPAVDGIADPAAGGASGIYFAKLIERLGIAPEINAKTTFPPPGGLVGHLLVSGAVDLAVQQSPELMEVAGVEILGTLPGDLHMVTTFVAGIEVSSAEVTTAKALIDLLAAPSTAVLFREKGLDPA